MRIKLSALLIATVVLAACGDSASPTAPQSPASTTTIASLSVDAETVQGGTATQGAVTLSAAAPAGGFNVTLSSTNGAVTVPASVMVAAGATSAPFTITTSAVAANADIVISASAGGVTRTASLRVTATAPLVALSSAHADIIGGTDSTGTIALASPAPSGGTRVTLASDHPSVDVPLSITVPAGSRSATFEINTRRVSEAVDVTITASFATTARTAGSRTLTMVVKVVPAPNTAPVATADSYTTDEDTALTVGADSGVLANDTDADNDTLTVEVVSGPSKGTLTLSADGSFTYTPVENFAGSDSFTYVAGDNATSSDVATVTLSVTHRIDDELLFSYNGTDGRDGSPETWKVPDGVTAIEVEAFGAQGGTAGNLAPGGLGGRIEVVTAVVPGETLQIRVGGSGILAAGADDGGYNGGGHGGQYNPGAGGGGGSDVRRGSFTLDERLVAAGGGGGGAWNSSGGGASGTVGANGCSGGGPGGGGGGGATAALPGAGGTASGNATAGGPGASGQGGAGGVGVDESQSTGTVSNGGGGGGGWFGGGGGGGGYLAFEAVTGFVCGGGGGGGSNGAAAGITIQVNENGVNTGHGKVIIRW